MSINAIEVLEARFANRFEPVANRVAHVQKVAAAYHSPEWWEMMWQKHEAWREATYPPPAGTAWDVTPATGGDG